MTTIVRLICCEDENLRILTTDIRHVMRVHLARRKCDELACMGIELSLSDACAHRSLHHIDDLFTQRVKVRA